MNHGSVRSRIVYFFREEESEDIQLVLANNSQSREGTSTDIQANSSSPLPLITTSTSMKSVTKLV